MCYYECECSISKVLNAVNMSLTLRMAAFIMDVWSVYMQFCVWNLNER